MIDRSRHEQPNLHPPLGIPIPGLAEPEPQGGASVADLYDKLFSDGGESSGEAGGAYGDHEIPHDAPAATAPPAPVTLRQTGLSLGTITDLILKQLYLQGNLLGIQFARQMRLPFTVVEEGLKFLKDDKCIEVASGDLVGPVSYRFNLTDLGRKRAREAFEQCRYVGPAPVPLEAYVPQCRRQTVTGTECSSAATSTFRTPSLPRAASSRFSIRRFIDPPITPTCWTRSRARTKAARSPIPFSRVPVRRSTCVGAACDGPS
jgi:hypothetical protein